MLCYHSRYRLSDRAAIHQATVAAFQQRAQPAIAVTTQVCEMSLDLDADVMLSELAPIPALVQRLGRANRHMAGGPGQPAEVWLYPPRADLPYDREEMDAARAFVAQLGPEPLSQRTLSEKLEALAPAQTDSAGASRFLDGGYYAVPGSIRDDGEPSSPCVLDSDLADVTAALAARKPIDGWLVPVSLRFAREPAAEARSWPAWLKVASASCYQAGLGFVTSIEEVD